MPWRIMHLAGCLYLISQINYASEADVCREKAIAALKQSQTNPGAFAVAARNSARAAQEYTASGVDAFAAEMNAYLYYCKKKMSSVAAADLTKENDKIANEAFAAIDKVVDAEKAKAYLESAEAFAEAWPNEHLLCAIRFFEVAERFKETLPGLTAIDRYKSSLANAEEAAGQKKEPVPAAHKEPDLSAVNLNSQSVEQQKRLPIPAADGLAEADKRIRTKHKDDFAKRKPEDRTNLAKKLFETWADSSNDDTARYAHLVAARDVAAEGGDAKLALQIIDRLVEKYDVKPTSEKLPAFKKLVDAPRINSETSRFLLEAVLKTIDEAVAAEEFGVLKQLSGFADAAAKKADSAMQAPRVKAKLALVDEIQREWGLCKPALEVFKADRNNPEANLTVGRFYCFMKGDFDRGLRCLARSSNEDLKKVAVSDQLNPPEPLQQNTLGDSWWNLAEKEKSRQAKLAMMTRAAYWYAKAYPALAKENKEKGEKRIAQFETVKQVYAPPLFEIVGRWAVKWTKHAEKGQKFVEIAMDGAIKASPADFGEYAPDRWTFKDQRILIHCTNNALKTMDIVDENTMRMETSLGETTFTRVKK